MEFHAIVLCGEGQRLAPVSGPGGIPKGLLPVNNKPMVSYVLDWCIDGNFKDITVVSPSEDAPEYKAYIESAYAGGASAGKHPVIEVTGIDARTTGEVIGQLRSKIDSDFAVLPCDVITTIKAQTLIDAHRKRDDNNTLISGIYYKNRLENIDKKSLTSDYIVHTPLTDNPPTLLDVLDREAVSTKKMMEMRMGMIWKYSNTVVSSNFLTSAIYLCSKRLLQVLDQDIKSWNDKSWHKVVRDVARRSWKHTEPRETVTMRLLCDDKKSEKEKEKEKETGDEPTIIRSNNLSAYMEANRYILKQNARVNATSGATQKSKSSSNSSQGPGPATVGADSTVGKDTTLGEKSSVKRSVVGNGCTIGKKCRLTGCVILDNVTIEDDVILENCIIGKSSTIQTKAKLTSCNVEGNYNVAKGSQAKNETLQKLTLGGFSDDETSSGSDSETDDEDGSDWGVDEEDDEELDNDDGLFDR